MKLPDLSDNPEAAKKQWRAVRSLIYSQEKQISHYRKRVQELEKELSLVDKTEIDALYETIERLTNELEGKMKIRSWEPEERLEFKQEIHWIATTLGICPSRVRIDGSHPVGEDVIFIDNIYNGYLDTGFYDFMMLEYDPWDIYKGWIEMWRNKNR